MSKLSLRIGKTASKIWSAATAAGLVKRTVLHSRIHELSPGNLRTLTGFLRHQKEKDGRARTYHWYW